MQATLSFAHALGPLPQPRGRAELDDLRHHHRRALEALAQATERAERAERRLRSRLVELTWPAALGGIAGGFAAAIMLRLAGA